MAYKRTSPLQVIEGGTELTTITDHSVMVGSGTSPVTPITVGTNGQLLIGSTGADPVFATASSSDSLLTLTGGAGSLDITANHAVSSSSTLTDNLVVRGDGGTRGVQTSTVSITDNGEMTNTSQPAFLATVTSTIGNVTGDGTTYTVIYDTEYFDQNSDFNTGSGTFTAPVTGRYHFNFATYLVDLGAAHTAGVLSLVTSNRSYLGMVGNAANWRAASNDASFIGAVLADMDAGDTATVTITIYNSTKTVDVGGVATNGQSYFSGALIC